MRSRRGHSRSSDKGSFQRVIIEGLKPPFDKDDSIRTWLARYGTVEGKRISGCVISVNHYILAFCGNIKIERFHKSIVVKFSSELQAAEVVRCENGIRGSGSNIKVHLADSDTFHQLVRVRSNRKRSLSLQQKRSASSRSGSSTRLARKPRLKTVGSRQSDVRSQPSKGETPAQEPKEATISSQQQHQHHSLQIPSTSRSSGEYDVAILAITHDLVQYAEAVQALLHRRAVEERGGVLNHQDQGQPQEVTDLHVRPPRVKIMVLMSVDHIAPCMQDLGEEGVLFAILLNTANMTHNSCTLRILHSSTQQEHRNMPLPDAIDLLLRDFSEYLEVEASSSATVSKATSLLPLSAPSLSSLQRHSQQPQQLKARQQKQMRHRRRCCRHHHRHISLSSPSTCTSISSSSLSFRTASSSATSSSRHLHKSKRRSHQLQQQKQPHLHRRRNHPQQQCLAREETDAFLNTLGVETIPAPDDPSFLAPSRHVAVLLRMLADSRILSVGELDEISAFIAQRRARLTSELISGNVNPRALNAEEFQFVILEPRLQRVDFDGSPLFHAGVSSNAALKARIMETLYPSFRGGGGVARGHVTSTPSTALQARRSLPANVTSSSTDVVRSTTAAAAVASSAAVVPTQTPSVGTASSKCGFGVRALHSSKVEHEIDFPLLILAGPLVRRVSPSSQLCIDTSEPLSLNESRFSSAGEVIITPNVGPKKSMSLHREALSFSRYHVTFSNLSNRRFPRPRRGLKGKFRKNGSE
ncbi:unnamed protein product [Hydatigera taeniaeformis]|uniref:RRM domain-containing protein n=1 Tax=Hydatigena taeniaeformis TaxID=6205 RepID=A0A0R3WKE5_HYDTA|nr:unnamed protein product [Hydatigera taeniaeformis]